jgi:hypothetical protein
MTSMATGISIHIGVNHVDQRHYGSECTLYGCVADARAMHALAQAAGFEARLLLNEEATTTAVLAAIADAAPRVGSDGLLLLTYSGHGGRVPDRGDNDRDPDHYDHVDESWCLHDRELIDDELYACWPQFAAGARILVVSDSCYSGGVIRDDKQQPGSPPRRKLWGGEPVPQAAEAVRAMQEAGKRSRGAVMRGGGGLRRALSPKVARRVYNRNHALYDQLQATLRHRDPGPVEAHVVVLSAAWENETAADGDENGAFTHALVEEWGGGVFKGDYAAFHAALLKRLAPGQHPMLLWLRAPAFIHQRPFTI